VLNFFRGNGAMTDLERLQKTIRDLHGLESTHVMSMRVNEMFEGKPVWSGLVEVFQVDHPKAQYAFAWSYKGDDDKLHYVAVLGVPPITNPQDAVRAYIVAQAEKERHGQ
jgi:hypothetical protein